MPRESRVVDPQIERSSVVLRHRYHERAVLRFCDIGNSRNGQRRIKLLDCVFEAEFVDVGEHHPRPFLDES
jgi:hypothetical protein